MASWRQKKPPMICRAQIAKAQGSGTTIDQTSDCRKTDNKNPAAAGRQIITPGR